MKVSIIIPSRERAYYLNAAIQSVLDIDDDGIELIVADNASTDNTKEVVEAFDDPRLVYLPSERRVSMRENFNRSILASSGDYIITFGDDDAIVPGQFPALRKILETHEPDGVNWFKSGYFWPVDGYMPKRAGSIRLYRSRTFNRPVPYDPAAQLPALLACETHNLFPAPNIYHGCISRAYLERVKPGPDLYFDGTIPDVNFQYRAIFNGGNFLEVLHPFTINGASPKSNGHAQLNIHGAKGAEQIARMFTEENRADPYDDIIDHCETIDLVIFATLETLRQRSGFMDHRPDYQRWYHYAMKGRERRPDKAPEIEATLRAHAEATGSLAEFEAQAEAEMPKRTARQRIKKGLGEIGNFKLSCELNGENTILNGVRIVDHMLGDAMVDVTDGKLSASAAWRAARSRAKAFDGSL
ncbi:glycosyltransferase family 2 protein [Hasllibacter sp. MH4015]|uniref:glycosyltransferase family 2 protein n=1 Tax=Hasllibacter sp. MH4015 TaxID=2854029 RepID=UPI001CD34233